MACKAAKKIIKRLCERGIVGDLTTDQVTNPITRVSETSQFFDIFPPACTVTLETYVLGDLNCNLLDQTNFDNDAKHLLRILEIYQLTQLITKPTRITQRSKSLLDVLLPVLRR